MLGFNFISSLYYALENSSAQELEKDIHGSAADSLPAEKKLVLYDKIFAAYHEARSCIRNDLVSNYSYHVEVADFLEIFKLVLLFRTSN